jgi:TonB family protein
MEPVTAVLLERQREAANLRPMLTGSILVHAAGIALLLIAPARFMRARDTAPRTVMTISLGGGAPGPRTGGMTPLSGRPVQTAAPAPDVKQRAPITPPAAKTPEMVLPNKSKTARPAPKDVIKAAPEDARGRTATRGAEVKAGTALAQTGSNFTGIGGLASGGQGGVGGYLDVGNFCCPDYIETMKDLIFRNWNARQGVSAQNMVKFTIQRDGTLTDIEVEQRSEYPMVDLASERALRLTARLPPLPAAFPNSTLTVHLRFQY